MVMFKYKDKYMYKKDFGCNNIKDIYFSQDWLAYSLRYM